METLVSNFNQQILFSKCVIPEQLLTSVSLSKHGIVPPLKLLILLFVAMLSHAPEQAPHGFHVVQVPSPVDWKNITFKQYTNLQTIYKDVIELTLTASCLSSAPSARHVSIKGP